MSTSLREYRRAIALAALDMKSAPLTAGELTETMGAYALAEGHPAGCWQSLNASEVLGVLRSLETEGSVVRDGERRDSRAGRDSPTWRLSNHMRGEVSHLIPIPQRFEDPDGPDAEEIPIQASSPPPAEAASPYGDMSRPQLYALLEVSDRLAGVQASYMRELQETTSWARAKLAEVGLS